MTSQTPATFPSVDFTAWRQSAASGLGGGSFERRLVAHLPEGLELQPLYGDRSADVSGLPTSGRAEWERHWEIASGDPRAARQRVALALELGASGLRLGAGCAGALTELLGEIDPRLIALHFTEPGAAAALSALAKERGLEPSDLRGGLGLAPRDIDAEALEPWGQGFDSLLLARIETTHDQLEGAGMAQQVGIALAGGAEALRRVERAGLEPTRTAPAFEFEFSLGTDFFVEIAKLRAFRLAWARLVTASGGTAEEGIATVHARNSERSWAARDPWVNLLRGTTESFAAALGGADSIVTLPFDACLGAPDSSALRLASNTQALLAEEAGLDHVIDPAAGCGYVETLTEEIARRAWEFFTEIEGAGGLEAARSKGLISTAIAEVAAREAQAVAHRRHGLIGVSEFPDANEVLPVREPGGIAESTPRLSKPFETLRDRSDAHAERTGERPAVFLANLGTQTEFRARAAFTTMLLASGGIAAIDNEGFASDDEACEALGAANTSLCAICSTDERYLASVPTLAPRLAALGATLILAGKPGEHEEAWREAGVQHFIHIGSDAVHTLAELLESAEVEA